MQSEMDAAAEEMLGSPPPTPSETSGLRRQPSGSSETPLASGIGAPLSAYERVRMHMVPEMIMAVQMFTASIRDVFGKSVQTEDDMRQVSSPNVV